MRITPKDSTDALRLMRKHADALLTEDDTAEEKEHIQGVIAAFLAGKRAGKVEADVEFLDWYETGDIAALMEEEAPDPTE